MIVAFTIAVIISVPIAATLFVLLIWRRNTVSNKFDLSIHALAVLLLVIVLLTYLLITNSVL